MSLTPEIEAEIVAKYRQTRSPFKTAHAVGVDVAQVFAVIDNNSDQLTPIQERHGGMGRPEMQQFIVARRRSSVTEWNNEDEKIAAAREDFETGTHIMATGRDGAWLILYSIPRKGRPDPMPGYFLPEVA
jgi:hypothetical protein